MMTSPRRLVSWTLVLACLLSAASASRVAAFSGGITSQSFSPAVGCNGCHAGGTAPTVTLTGPLSVQPDSTHEYTVTVSDVGMQHLAGLNVVGPSGVLATGGGAATGTQTIAGAGGLAEITHTAPKAAAGGVTTFSFLWTAPSAFTSVTLAAWGNAVNGNFSSAGDRASRRTLDIINATLPTAVPTATPTPVATPTDRIADPLPRAIRRGARVALQPVASGFDAPVAAKSAPGIDARYLYVVDQSGTMWRVDLTDGSKIVFLDVTSRLVSLGVFGPGSYDERGFLGAAFHAQYATNGLLYTYTSEPVAGPADFSTMPPLTTADHQAVITAWHVPTPTDPNAVVDPLSAREVLRIDEPQFNHNGGALQMSPLDGYLYISLGDGGAADDEDGQPFIGGPSVGHGPTGNAQNLANPLGKLLRIDPLGTNAANGRYGVPADNPFVGTPGALGEIWAYGFRNPYRFSFDRVTGELYVGDVGQNDVEEIDLVRRGGNYGWRYKEGEFFFRPNGTGAGYVSKTDPGGVPTTLLDPVAQYDHSEGLSVIGGYLASSPSLRRLNGHYVFGEFARTFANDGRIFYLKKKGLLRKNGKLQKSQIAEVRYPVGVSLGLSLLGIGEGGDGEIYALANSTAAPAGGTGVVLKLSEP
ncbi:MAG: choice-of-anchor V domain-containing protein [Candidatus Binatia bacterium]